MTDTAAFVGGPAQADTVPQTITEPGFYQLTDTEYHADPVPGGSLSSGGARKLLEPAGPARFDHERRNPPPSKPEFEFGKAAHAVVLGAGADLAVFDASSWRTNAAKDFQHMALLEGRIPLLAAEYEQIQAMAAVVQQHEHAGPLFAQGAGVAEQSGFWIDSDTGQWCRFRADWIKHRQPGRRLVAADYKTCRSAAPADLTRDVWNYGYYVQAPWYLNGVRALGLDDDPVFVFVAQEKTPPYLVHTFQLDPAALRAGAAACRKALRIYAECRRTGVWPGYPTDEITTISLPPWAAIEEYA
jgi:PDDEXK-like domain of unknown function (DUF3799)